jgi:hypothetical protein
MVKRAVLQFLLVFLLLAGQQGALVHSVWHLNNHPVSHGLQDPAGAAHDQRDGGKSSQSRLCDLHSALGNLLAGDCSGLPAAFAAAASHSFATHAAAWRVAQPAPTPLSRAPPVLL